MPITHQVLQNALQDTAEVHGPGLFGLVTKGGEVVFDGSTGTAHSPLNYTANSVQLAVQS